MDALYISKNGIHQFAAELREAASLSVLWSWIGNEHNKIFLDVTRNDAFGLHRWKPFQVMVGDLISIALSEANQTDRPADSVTESEMVERIRKQPKMIPGKRTLVPIRNVGNLICSINNEHLFTFNLTTENMLSVSFVWLGDKSGMALISVRSDGLPQLEIPNIAFGDEITFRTSCS